MRWRYEVLTIAALAAACGVPPNEPESPDPTRQGTEQDWVYRDWIISVVPRSDLGDIEIVNDVLEGPGVVSVLREVGKLGLQPPTVDPEAYAEVYSNVNGHT